MLRHKSVIFCAIRAGGNLVVFSIKISVFCSKIVNICATCAETNFKISVLNQKLVIIYVTRAGAN